MMIAPNERVCRWTENEFTVWVASCGEEYVYFDGGPDTSEPLNCPKCGAPVVFTPHTPKSAVQS